MSKIRSMSKIQSNASITSNFDDKISSYYFALYPISLTFKKQYSQSIVIYFEKNLQIISKNILPIKTVKPNQKEVLPMPQNIQHFRIISDKNLDYQWSLYLENGIDNEEFMEAQKINLKNYWSQFLERPYGCHKDTISFNQINCSLQFVIVIGLNSEEILSNLQEFYKKNELNPEKNVSQSKTPQIEVKEEGKNVTEKEPAVQTKAEEVESAQGQSVLKVSSTIEVEAVKPAAEPVIIIPQQTPGMIVDQNEVVHEVDKEIVKTQIAQRSAIEKEQTPIAEVAATPEEPAPQPSSQKIIKRIQSQIVDENGQPVVPIYKNKKFIILAIVILLLITGLGVMSIKDKGKKKGAKGKRRK